jgi:hypothetical protein
MAVGGGVCVASPSPSSVEAWSWRTSGARRRAAVRCSVVGEAGPGAAGGRVEDPYRTLRLRRGATRGEVKKAFRRLALMVRPRAQPLPHPAKILTGVVDSSDGLLCVVLVQYHPDVRKEREREMECDGDSGVQFQRINVAYQVGLRIHHLSSAAKC